MKTNRHRVYLKEPKPPLRTSVFLCSMVLSYHCPAFVSREKSCEVERGTVPHSTSGKRRLSPRTLYAHSLAWVFCIGFDKTSYGFLCNIVL